MTREVDMQAGENAGSSHRGRACLISMIALHACVAVAALTASASATAQDRWGGSVAVTTDYVYRGLSLSSGRVAYQGGAHLLLPNQWQVGVWGSTVENRIDTGNSIEATAFVAHSWALTADWNARAGLTHYEYFGEPTFFAYSYDELFASVSYQSRLTLGASFSPNAARYRYQQTPLRASTAAFDTTWSQPLLGDWSGTVGLGYNDLSDLYGTGYAYWHAGLSGVVGPIELDLLFIDSNSHAEYIYGKWAAGERWSATARWRF